MVESSPGVLYLCATPIGNLEDITLRALRVLREADLVAAEDTRYTRKLLTHYGIKTALTSYHEHNKKKKGETLLRELMSGKKIALVTDAGLPGVSDPGEDIVRLALKQGVAVIPIPGPSAGITALVISGFSTRYFVFEGFLPSRKKDRKKRLELLKTETRTIILYESPHKLTGTLQDLMEKLGPERRMAAARELTKLHEEVIRGTINDLLAYFQSTVPKGEFTLVIEGSPGKIDKSLGNAGENTALVEHVAYLVSLGVDKRTAVREVARKLGIPKKEVYNAVIEKKI